MQRQPLGITVKHRAADTTRQILHVQRFVIPEAGLINVNKVGKSVYCIGNILPSFDLCRALSWKTVWIRCAEVSTLLVCHIIAGIWLLQLNLSPLWTAVMSFPSINTRLTVSSKHRFNSGGFLMATKWRNYMYGWLLTQFEWWNLWFLSEIYLICFTEKEKRNTGCWLTCLDPPLQLRLSFTHKFRFFFALFCLQSELLGDLLTT